MPANELGVRQLRKPDKHPIIFATYAALKRNVHSGQQPRPKHLHDEFEADYPGGYEWEYLDKAPPPGGSGSANSPTPLPRYAADISN